jgi:hypothetical protein
MGQRRYVADFAEDAGLGAGLGGIQEVKAGFKPHRLPAWGVLGSTTGGLPFLLTHPVVFRSM